MKLKDPRIGRSSRTWTLLAMLAAFLGLATVAPLLAWSLFALWQVAARTVDRSLTSLVLRRHLAGHRRSDVPMAVLSSPWHLVAAVVTTAFALLGFVIGLWAKNFEQLQIVPMMVITPLVFLGGAFYSASMLPPFWEQVAKLNPVLYLVSGFRWSFFGLADVPVGVSLVAVGLMIVVLLAAIRWIFLTGWRLRD